MIEIKNIEILTPLKKQYLTQNKAPLDGMWLCGYVVFYLLALILGFMMIQNLLGIIVSKSKGLNHRYLWWCSIR